MGTGLIYLLPGLLGGTFASGIGTGLLRGLPGLGGGIGAAGMGTGLTDLRRRGADGALFFGACARLVAAATPGSKLGSLVRFLRAGGFRFGAGITITSSDQLDDSI